MIGYLPVGLTVLCLMLVLKLLLLHRANRRLRERLAIIMNPANHVPGVQGPAGVSIPFVPGPVGATGLVGATGDVDPEWPNVN